MNMATPLRFGPPESPADDHNDFFESQQDKCTEIVAARLMTLSNFVEDQCADENVTAAVFLALREIKNGLYHKGAQILLTAIEAAAFKAATDIVNETTHDYLDNLPPRRRQGPDDADPPTGWDIDLSKWGDK